MLVKEVCSKPMKPFFPRMEEVLLENQRRMMKKAPGSQKIAPAAQLGTLRDARSVRRAFSVPPIARLRSVSNLNTCRGRLL